MQLGKRCRVSSQFNSNEDSCMHLRAIAPILFILFFLFSPPSSSARRQQLDLHTTSVDLPGAPSTILAPDLDGDGRRDLVVMVTFTEWDQLTLEETAEMDDIEGLVEVMTIVPALSDRRELHVFFGQEDGGYRAADHREIGTDILALEEGPAGTPVIALTDDGVSVLRWAPEGKPGERLLFEPWISDRPVFSGSRTFVPRLGLSHDLDGDGHLDFLMPSDRGPAVYLANSTGLATESTQRLVSPIDQRSAGGHPMRLYSLPRVEDINGDGRPDLLFSDDDDADNLAFHALIGQGAGSFSAVTPPLALPDPCPDDDEDSCPDGSVEFVYFGDLDGDGKAEYVTQEELPPEGDGMRKELKHAKRPPFRYQLFRSRPDSLPEAEPYATFDALGYSFPDGSSDDDGLSIPGGVVDLDGDGRRDLITLTLDFSVLQIMRVMTTRRLSIGLDFHIYCQQPNGDFKPVPDIDLSGKFKLDLDDIQVRQLSFFDGDFDGDGRADFVQLGRGRTVSIHRGQEHCRYSDKPDLILKLEEEPRNVALVRIDDFDADGFSDLLIVQPNRIEEPGVTPPVRLDMYLSRQGAQP